MYRFPIRENINTRSIMLKRRCVIFRRNSINIDWGSAGIAKLLPRIKRRAARCAELRIRHRHS